MTVTEDPIDRFESRSEQLIREAWYFVGMVAVLLLAGAVAVVFAPNLTANDIGDRTTEQKLATVTLEMKRLYDQRAKIYDGPVKDCSNALGDLAKQLVFRTGEIALDPGPEISVEPTGDAILSAIQQKLFPDGASDPKGTVRLTLGIPLCSITIYIYVDGERFKALKSQLPGKQFISPAGLKQVRDDLPELDRRTDMLDRINQQIDLEKTETELGLSKPTNSAAERGLFIRLLQTSVTRFGLLAVIGFFVSILVSMYRYNIRLAAFYRARADALRLFAPEIRSPILL